MLEGSVEVERVYGLVFGSRDLSIFLTQNKRRWEVGVWSLGNWVKDAGFRDRLQGLESGVRGCRIRTYGLGFWGFRLTGSGFRAWGVGCRVQGQGVRVWGWGVYRALNQW